MARLLLLMVTTVFSPPLAWSAATETSIAEQITFLQADGRHYVSYRTNRTDKPASNLLFKKERGRSPDEYLKPFFYIYPHEYSWDTTSDQNYNVLRFSEGSYATMRAGEWKERLTVTADGTYIYTSSDGDKTPDGHYGIWIRPANFTHYTSAWVFPEHFEIVGYECNRHGKWVVRHNTLTYYGKQVNDLVFTLKYRLRARGTYEILQATLRDQQEVRLEQLEQGVRLTLAATILFPSGKSELSEPGKVVLDRIAGTLTKRGMGGVIVEGHTDNTPISGLLAQLYPTNWELSAARALAVVRHLADKGLPEASLEARAYGATRPHVSNATEQGREKNRRIALLVMEPTRP